MQIALLPTLTPDEKAAVERWVRSVLGNNRLSINAAARSAAQWPLTDRLGIYIDGRIYMIRSGQWQLGAPYCYVGQECTIMALGERLAIIGAIISMAGLWTEMQDLYAAAVSRILLESYNTAMQGLVRLQGGTPATGLAFSPDRMQVAAMMGEAWRLPNGEAVEVDETWTIVQ